MCSTLDYEPDSYKPAKRTTLTDQFKEKLTMPLWALVCFVAFAGCAGMAAGILNHALKDSDGYAYLVAALGFIVAPFLLVKKKAKEPEAAVSPVIGVILMVAITVVLAAVVFTVVSKLAKDRGEPAPDMAFDMRDHGSRYVLVKAPHNLDWSQFTITGCTTLPTGDVNAGDELRGCSGDVVVVDNDSNTIVWTNGA